MGWGIPNPTPPSIIVIPINFCSRIRECFLRIHKYKYGYDRTPQVIFEKLKHEIANRIPLRHKYDQWQSQVFSSGEEARFKAKLI